MDLSQYLEIFIEETKEHLQGLNQSLLKMEQTPKDKGVLNEIFRVAHTLKGMSGTMGFTKMAKLTHDMESVLHALRNDEISVSTALVDILFKCLDALEAYLDNIIKAGNEGMNENNNLISDLNAILEKKPVEDSNSIETQTSETHDFGQALSSSSTANFQLNQYEQNLINKAKEMGMNVHKITIFLNKGCVLKSARSFIIFQTLERYSEIIKSVPLVEDIEDEKFEFEFTVVVISKYDEDTFLKELNSIAEVEGINITPMKSIISDLSSSSEINATDAKSNDENVNSENEESKDQDLNLKSAQVTKRQKTNKTVRVDIERLDILMNLVSELIIQKTRLEGIEGIRSSQVFSESLESLERITTDLHDAVMKVRMVPVETVFNRFPRMVRDISKEIGKEIVLKMSGEETELDRTVIDEIGDPLIHLLRNSVDHGIEAKEKRIQSGKSPIGQVNLRAYQEGNNVIIEVEDDGDGIDIEKVKMKAIERGLLNKDIANNLSEKEIIDFLFKPSFSTADIVTDLSGRGVGLDVVLTKIETLNGNVEVETVKGKGSRFIIRLPLTLAIIQALLVLIGDEKYAIPFSSIQSIEKITTEDIKMVQKQETILLRKTVVPIVRLDRVLEVQKEDKSLKHLTVVVVKKGERLSGFVVDSLIGQQEIVIKSLGKMLSGIKTISGATILGDGNVALILDVNTLA